MTRLAHVLGRATHPSPRIRRATRVAAALLAATLAAAPRRAGAHPGWGVVRDAAGNVYYTDLAHVWRVDARGRRSIVVRDVHTHELMLDSAGALYGEHAEFLGGDRFRHRVWRRTRDGRVEDVVPRRAGYRDGYGFVRGGDGALYWASCLGGGSCVVKRRDPAGRVDTAARGARFAAPLNFLAAAPDGTLLVADGADLHRITRDGRLVRVARALAREGGRFALMGVHAARDGRVYVAAHFDRAVIELAPDGTRRVAARSEAPWRPSGVLAAPDGLWVLEYDDARARLRHLRPDGRVRTFGP
jgi:sugar lactone lactonase YvrE